VAISYIEKISSGTKYTGNYNMRPAEAQKEIVPPTDLCEGRMYATTTGQGNRRSYLCIYIGCFKKSFTTLKEYTNFIQRTYTTF
jgi:hypothetical protein